MGKSQALRIVIGLVPMADSASGRSRTWSKQGQNFVTIPNTMSFLQAINHEYLEVLSELNIIKFHTDKMNSVKDAVLNIPGNVIYNTGKVARQAVIGVSEFATAQGGGGKKITEEDFRLSVSEIEDHLLKNAKDRVNVCVKCTPNKDALTTSVLAVKKGYLMKKNEQGQWQKRFICTVPHIFMYYYDVDKSDQPRGIIDLHYYKHMNMEGPDGNVLKLSADDAGLRSFYFQIEDPTLMNDWIASLHRDRFEIVRDERDAYMQLQDQFSGEINEAAKQAKSSAEHKERVQREANEAQRDLGRAKEFVMTALIHLAVARDTEDLEVCGEMLINGIADLKKEMEVAAANFVQELASQKAAYEEKLSHVEKRLSTEQVARKNGEAMLLNFKLESEAQRREAMSHFEQLSHNLQMALNAKDGLEAKIQSAAEHKKVLVREVKGLRKKLEDSEQQITQLKHQNEKYTAHFNQLQDQMSGLTTQVDGCYASLASSIRLGDKDNSGFVQSPTSAGRSSCVSLAEAGHITPSHQTSVEDGNEEESPERAERISEDSSTSVLGPKGLQSTSDRDNNHRSWEMPAVHLKELGWLSPEQQCLVEGRIDDTPGGVGVDPSLGKQPQSQSWSTLRFFGSSSLAHDTSSTPHGQLTTASQGQSATSTFSKPLSLLSSVFQSDKDKDKDKPGVAKPSSSSTLSDSDKTTDDKAKLSSIDQFYSPPDDSDTPADSEKPSHKLYCLRCSGTVEGPKFSTCKCAVPALTIDELEANPSSSSTITAAASSAFRGMFNGTSQAFKKII